MLLLFRPLLQAMAIVVLLCAFIRDAARKRIVNNISQSLSVSHGLSIHITSGCCGKTSISLAFH